MSPIEYYKQLKRLEAENARLKEENKILQQAAKTLAEGVCKQNEIASNYKQTLQKIQKIAEEEFNKKLKDKDCFNCDDSFKQIIDKISEVLDER